jgi:acyl carrier protein
MVSAKGRIPGLGTARMVVDWARTRGVKHDLVTRRVFHAIDDYMRETDMTRRKITERSTLVENLGFDSLDVMELGQKLKEGFKIHVPDDAEIYTVGDAINFVKDRIPPEERAKFGLKPVSMDFSHLSAAGKRLAEDLLRNVIDTVAEECPGLAAILNNPNSDIVAQMSFRFESEKDIARILKQLKERELISISQKEAANVRTIGDIVYLLLSKGVEP